MNNDDYDENDESSFSAEEGEQLLRANEHLRQQLASLTSLSASLAQQQAGEALVRFGEGPATKWLNARSIRMLSLGTYAVLVDELQVTEHLPLEQAEQTLDEVAAAIIRAIQPPEVG